MGDARGHLAEGDDLFLPDHGALIQPQAFGHGADAPVLARQASALAAQVAGDVVGQGDGHEQRKDEAGENEHFGMSARDLAGPGERFDEQTDRGQGAAISQHPRQKQARENHVKNEKPEDGTVQARGPTREQGQTHQVEQHLCDRQPKQPAFLRLPLQEREQRDVVKQDDQPQDEHLGRCGMPAEDKPIDRAADRDERAGDPSQANEPGQFQCERVLAFGLLGHRRDSVADRTGIGSSAASDASADRCRSIIFIPSV